MIFAVVTMQSLVVFLPFMHQFFNTNSIDLVSLAWAIVPGIAVFTVLEIEKCLNNSSRVRRQSGKVLG
jgi:hypothetical protein